MTKPELRAGKMAEKVKEKDLQQDKEKK